MLQKTGNITTAILSTIIQNVCYPILGEPTRVSTHSRTTENRQMQHLANDLLQICCGLSRESLLKEVLDDCICCLSSFVDETEERLDVFEEVEQLGRSAKLHISGAIDILGGLLRYNYCVTDKTKTEGKKHGSLICEEDQEKLFCCLLKVFYNTDDSLCLKITGGLLPSLLQPCSDRIQVNIYTVRWRKLMAIWDLGMRNK